MNFMDLKTKNPTHKMVFAAIMAGIAIVLNFIEIPYIVPYLRFDASEAIVIIVVMLAGLRYGLMVSIIKALVFFMMGSNGNDPIGTAVLLFSSCFLAIVFYLFYTKLSLLPSLIITGIIFSIAMTALNFFVTLPLYMGKSFAELNQDGNYLMATVSLYLPFNLIKMTIVSTVVLVMDKLLFSKRK